MSAPPLEHLAVIMDGNGRWAQRRRLPRSAGHRAGARALRRLVEETRRVGVPWLTVFAFSTENWARPSDEVDGLMMLLASFLVAERPALIRHRIELRVLGDVARLPRQPRALLLETCAATADLDGMRLALALSYGGRDELVRCVRSMAEDVAAGRLAPGSIDAEQVAGRLDTRGGPDPDLVIRTGGEQRLSNFLLWQTAYSELYFTPTLWPDFGPAELESALEWYRGRQRTFGSLVGAVSCEADRQTGPRARRKSARVVVPPRLSGAG
jgi:undecaprenyl diphosphate synthase